ncbi:hypothetical protein C1701_18375 [Actinoalloteichus sp. AHMU CJ021]|uniref:hypothetical protein n=1 Tax=Actinoalloteichus sp. AHMU CJ021 TaxID=2072503 RepID=UPI000CA04C8E|nr:hypothetical protein C1701_18375 [Actinoalloteichus sp. AHMU CJ021]
MAHSEPARRDPVTAEDLDRAAEGVLAVLAAATDREWREVRAAGLDWTCHATAEHVADDLFFSAVTLAGRSHEQLACWLRAEDGATAAQLVEVIRASAALLTAAFRTAPPGARGACADGRADAEGLLAVGVAELVLHGYDLALGLGLDYRAPVDVARRLLGRLSPQIPEEGWSVDSWHVLLWSTGRADIPGVDAVGRWQWQVEPLDEPRPDLAPVVTRAR